MKYYGHHFSLIAFILIFTSHLASAVTTENVMTNVDNTGILILRTSHTYKAKAESFKEQAKLLGIKVDSKRVSEIDDITDVGKLFASYDLVILDAASKRETKKEFEKFIPLVKAFNCRCVAIKWHTSDELNNRLKDNQAKRLFEYYDNGGDKNFYRMANYIQNKVFNNQPAEVEKPIIYPEVGIYHPDYEHLIFENLSDYKSWFNQQALAKVKSDLDIDSERPVIGIMMQRALVESSQTDVIDSTIVSLEKKGAMVIPFFFEVSPDASAYKQLITINNKTVVDVIINFRTIHWATKRKQEFADIGVPIIQALTYFDGDQKDWESDPQGISPGMTSFLLVLPETAGVIDPQIIAARNKVTEKSEVIDYQLEHLINKTLNYSKLKRKQNKDKKLTVFFWGDRDMGASFLNVPDSLHVISHELKEQQYNINGVTPEFFTERVNRILDPFYRDYQLDELLADDLAELLPVKNYRQWFSTLPENVTSPIIKQWGEPEDNFMVVEREGIAQFVIPRIRNGNMLVIRQPPRADDKDQDKLLYHQGDVPMNHYYLAAYFYARKYWQSDAIIHLGTHGSQEYLGGKERGLSRYDGPNLAVGDTPVFYPFIVDDVGEAMQTKRRGSATVISHMTPPFAAAGLQGDTADIHELMHQYKSLDDGGVKNKTADQIINKCIESNICRDFSWDETSIRTDFVKFMDSLHDYLGELASENQPLGLHSFGELAEKRLLISTLIQMLGDEFTQQASDFENEFKNESEHDQQHAFHETETEIEQLAGYQTVKDFIVDPVWQSVAEHAHESTENHSHQSGEHDHGLTAQQREERFTVMGSELKKQIENGKRLFANLTNIKELDHLLKGLSGQFIPVKTGGDPIRHPESVPTGFNLYGFDPARLPTKAAYEQGKELVEGVINDFRLENGHYPDKLAFSLWSIEAMRHYGVLESQALYAIGVTPVWSDDGRVIGTEIIPASQLKRPRVDIVLSATGLYRDAFPNVIQRLAKAIEQIAKLKEDSNSIWKNSQRIKEELLVQGHSEDEALYLSSIRIFSNASGQYGSGTDGPVFASDTWENDSKIANNYLAKMGFAFGTDPKRWGQRIEGLDLYGKQLSGTDIAMFSRSSNIYGMLSSDDPFEYFGSLSLAIRNLDGKSPKMLISNLRNASEGKMQDAAQFLATELRTRQFHKRWIEEMQKEGYSGAVTMASQISNFWGWQVVDPNLVRDDQWQEFHEIYVKDKLDLKLNEWFEKVNPGAQAQLIERMLEAARKDYWQASEQTREELVERYIDLVKRYDLFIDNQKLKDFVNQTAVGFGLNPLVENIASQSPAASLDQSSAKLEQVKGQQLEKVTEKVVEREWDSTLIWMLVFCGLTLVVGGIKQSRRSYRFNPI